MWKVNFELNFNTPCLQLAEKAYMVDCSYALAWVMQNPPLELWYVKKQLKVVLEKRNNFKNCCHFSQTNLLNVIQFTVV